jgi:hypothetical protein
MRKRVFELMIVTVVSLLSGCGGKKPAVSLERQLEKLSTVMTFCQPARSESDMFSSYDRRGGNVDWYFFAPPIDGKELYEVTTLTGPGCLNRIWQTNIPVTEWLFYFDGEAEARFRIASSNLFSQSELFNPLQGGVSGGAYSYLPLPYEKSLKIVLRIPGYTPEGRPYFHINSERYALGTKVTSWPKAYDSITSNKVIACNAMWRQTPSNQTQIARSTRAPFQKQVIPSKQKVTIFSTEEQGIIKTFRFKPKNSALNAITRSLMLRNLVLEMYWNGMKEPSVRVPLGDFFCNGLHQREFANMAFSFSDGTYSCSLPMPFKKGARLVICNDGPFQVEGETSVEWSPEAIGDRLYLHASFNAEVSTGQPFKIMRTTGNGKYVGCYLMALGMDGGWNILEGDERFFRDGNKTFSHHGTGLEDYFNGGWYYYGLFELPLHGLLEKAAMRTAQYRFHLNDPVTFKKDLRMEIEFGDANTAGGYLSAAAYWYQDQPVGVKSEIPAVEKRFVSIDKVGVVAIMAELFELERAGLIREAQERCEFYGAAFGNDPNRLIFVLRAATYAEILNGYAAVRNAYTSLADDPQVPKEIAEQAKLLRWRGEKPGRGIFGAHGFSAYTLFVDGKPIGSGNHPQIWSAFPVELTPGEHFLEVEVTPNHAYSFLSCGFSAFFTNIVSDVSWDYCVPSAKTEDPDSKWRPYASAPGFFPGMAFWQFVPNAFPCVQSGYQHGPTIPKWTDKENLGRPVRIRRKVIVPEDLTMDRPPKPPRVYSIQGKAARPADDTSNDHLDAKR